MQTQTDIFDSIDADVAAAVSRMTATQAANAGISQEQRRNLDLAAAIVGRMAAECAADLSDAEIERTLGPCVCGPMLIRRAKEFRDQGLLTCKCDPQPVPQMACCPACSRLRPQFGSF